VDLLGVEPGEEGVDLCVVDLGDGVDQGGVGSRLLLTRKPVGSKAGSWMAEVIERDRRE